MGVIKPFEKKIWLASPTMYGEEQKWVDEAILTNWVSTVGANINEVEKMIANYVGCKYAVALSAVIYARVNNLADEPMLDEQIKALRVYCKSKGYEIIREIKDCCRINTISGSLLEVAEELQKM